MLTYSRQTRIRFLQIGDGTLFALALLLAYSLRAWLPVAGLQPLEKVTVYAWLFPLIAILGPLVLARQQFYRLTRLSSRPRVVLVVLKSVGLIIVALISFLFLTRLQYARSVIILAAFFGGVFAYLRHELSMSLADTPLAQSQWRQRVLWVGVPEENTRLRNLLSPDERLQIENITEFDPRVESVEQLSTILHDFAINAVIVNLASIDAALLTPVISACEREGVAMILRPALPPTTTLGMNLDWFAGQPVIHYRAQAAPPSHLVVKQILDFTVGGVLCLLASPLLLITAIGIKLTSPGPVLFRQTRAGLNGRPFQLLKFRSMRAGAERERASLAPRNEMTGPVFKLSNDPRITSLGRFLRRHSIDELPQLWNVIRGEMSLVGPRPLPLEEVKRFSDDAHRRRLSVRPGLTCLWQIQGRNDIADFNEWVRLDLAYIDHWSLWLDARILAATIPVVLFGRGAR